MSRIPVVCVVYHVLKKEAGFYKITLPFLEERFPSVY